MCNDCFNNEIYSFETQSGFDEFNKLLDKKTLAKKLLIIDVHEQNSLSILDSLLYFQCLSCSENWVMLIPDYSWRGSGKGYFLTNDNAIKHHDELHKYDRKKTFLGILFLIIIVILSLMLFV
tara:strand:+ start:356 stop:721 length:366 start_codon:yes stop_codon:yes gene_type:complete